MSKTRICLLLLTLLLIGWLAYRCAPTPIEHEGYCFELPMDFEEAVSKFGLQPLSLRMAVRFDDRGWLKMKAISNYPLSSERMLGLNFYYDDTVDVKAVMQSIEKRCGKNFQSGVGIYSNSKREWWYLKIDSNILILVYCHKYYTPSNLKGEEQCVGKGQDRQWVVAFTDKLSAKFQERVYHYMMDRFQNMINNTEP